MVKNFKDAGTVQSQTKSCENRHLFEHGDVASAFFLLLLFLKLDFFSLLLSHASVVTCHFCLQLQFSVLSLFSLSNELTLLARVGLVFRCLNLKKNFCNSYTGSSDQTLEKMETGATSDHNQDVLSQVQEMVIFI